MLIPAGAIHTIHYICVVAAVCDRRPILKSPQTSAGQVFVRLREEAFRIRWMPREWERLLCLLSRHTEDVRGRKRGRFLCDEDNLRK